MAGSPKKESFIILTNKDAGIESSSELEDTKTLAEKSLLEHENRLRILEKMGSITFSYPKADNNIIETLQAGMFRHSRPPAVSANILVAIPSVKLALGLQYNFA